MSGRRLLGALIISVLTASAGGGYRSATVDSEGRLHIESDSGSVIEPAMLKGQVAFSDAAVSPDGQTVGWLAMYPYPNPPGANYVREPIAGALVLYRSGHVIHRFATEQTFWDWRFQDGGKRVAYSTGPTHGGAAECVLREVDSGKVLEKWQVQRDGDPPEWARGLRI